jgi:hypothetical protein
MFRGLAFVCFSGAVLLGPVQDAAKPRVADGPSYTADGQLRFPDKYREWVFLGSGLDMSYNPKPTPMGAGMFNNVFVNPEAYRSFQQTGHWPQGTALVLENRGAEAGKSINKAGRTQSAELMGLEVHVLDSARLDAGGRGNGWAFYSFDNKVSAAMIPKVADCYSCHEQHGAVDTTFVQFYPTVMETAVQKQTVSAAYLKELAAK